jgi:hypothetical protein
MKKEEGKGESENSALKGEDTPEIGTKKISALRKGRHLFKERVGTFGKEELEFLIQGPVEKENP